jgi:hypothetical protein
VSLKREMGLLLKELLLSRMLLFLSQDLLLPTPRRHVVQRLSLSKCSILLATPPIALIIDRSPEIVEDGELL